MSICIRLIGIASKYVQRARCWRRRLPGYAHIDKSAILESLLILDRGPS